MQDVTVFSGSAHPALAAEICDQLGVALSPSTVQRFATDCLEVHCRPTVASATST